jgi:hypothetical protein
MKLWLLVLLAITPGLAKDLSSWDAVVGVSTGARVQVSRKSGDTLKGSLAAATASAVSVQTNSGEVTVQRAEVTSIAVRQGGSKARWIGLAVGAVAGIGAGAALGTRLANEGQADKAGVTAGVGAAGAAIGFGLGMAAGSEYKTIYRTK